MPFGVALARFVEFAEQFFLAIGQIDRRFDDDMAEQVAMAVAADALDALAAQSEDPAGLGFRRNPDGGGAIQGRDFDLATQCGGSEGNRHFAMQIVVVALKNRMLLEVNLHVQVAGWATVDAMFAFAGKPDTIAFIDTCWNFYR